MNSAEQTRRFCSALFGGPDGEGDDRLHGLHMAVWSLPSRRSRWCPAHELDTIVSTIRDLADRQGEPDGQTGIYFSAGMVARPREKGRVNRVDVVAIPALWADIDIAGDVHESKPYPRTVKDAVRVAEAAGAPPTMIVHTGNGIQPWWVLTEPFISESEQDREQMANMLLAWNRTLSYHANRLGGWKIDSTFDTARVMRVPGALNLKTNPGKPVRILSDGGPTYELGELGEYLADEKLLAELAAVAGSGSAEPVAGVNLGHAWARARSYSDVDYTPPWLEMLLEIDTDSGPLAMTWNGQRNDLSKDQSSYDAALTRILHDDYTVGPEQIAEALMCRRLRNGEKPDKVDPSQRTDYLFRTLNLVLTDQRKRDEWSERTRKIENAAHGNTINAVATLGRPAEPDAADYTPKPAPAKRKPETNGHPVTEEPPEDRFADYVNDLIDVEEPDELAAAVDQVENEDGRTPETRMQPVAQGEEPGESAEDEADPDAIAPPDEQTLAVLDIITELLLPEQPRERGMRVIRLERMDSGNDQMKRIGLEIPSDYDWPTANRPGHYRPGEILFTTYRSWREFETPRGFIQSVQNDLLLTAEAVSNANKTQWSDAIRLAVPYWMPDSTGVNLAKALVGWLLDYLSRNPPATELGEVALGEQPWLIDHRNWGADGPPRIAFSMGHFFDKYLATVPGAPRSRMGKGLVTENLRLTRSRPRVNGTRLYLYEIDPGQFRPEEWERIARTCLERFQSQGRRMRVVEGGAG